ncbi:MAG: hypothetical protein CVT63_05770 [Candidatus Anoxymicrobium japonicum]|uniref:Uncharacterized protein n=1 Tax=Candidatus Anoxymicrobium japonicum TaxID=2013648 RepID=A0A2N3G575_9ACTN|nr:MAG: hypothetical protein CVT63_05770 [Candidatus Anoxymicrobium japonicum]
MEKETVNHLDLIQGIINRLGRNSFAYKGWAITIISAIFALAVTKNVRPLYFLIALVPALLFWGLDAYYLRQEHLFRALYDEVRKNESSALPDGIFSMKTEPFVESTRSWISLCFSKSVLFLYCPLAVIVIAVTIVAYVVKK